MVCDQDLPDQEWPDRHAHQAQDRDRPGDRDEPGNHPEQPHPPRRRVSPEPKGEGDRTVIGKHGGNPVMARSNRPMRIAQLAGPMVPVPPRRIRRYRAHRRSPGDGADQARPRGDRLRIRRFDRCRDVAARRRARPLAYRLPRRCVSSHLRAVARCWTDADLDIVHSHVESFGFPFARHAPVPVITTLHGRRFGARAAGEGGYGAPDRIRTCDLRLRRPTLYPLSYRREATIIRAHARVDLRHLVLRSMERPRPCSNRAHGGS